MTSAPIGYGVKVCPGCKERNCVPPDLVEKLRGLGFHKPVGSLADPRLQYPELFLIDGWQRVETESGVRYEKEGDGCSQSVDFGEDKWRRITTRFPDHKQIVGMSLNGRVQQWVESEAVPALDGNLHWARPDFESFEASGELMVGHDQRGLSPAEALKLAAEFRQSLAQLHQQDQTPVDTAKYPGEVRTEDTQARFWGTPCGWKMSRYDHDGNQLTMASSDGLHLWAVQAQVEGPMRAVYLDLQNPGQSYEQMGAAGPDLECIY
ncbi:MAG: hypothetical protein KC910_10115 [Candidatus Eremiobacteraeota bacterium]|nr:hypothetical protein [Candidatus Eremiobacteraeota bacterium]